MDKLFLTILNMSFTGSFVIAAVCLARLPLKKAPKVISYCLWAVAGFRLIIPFSIKSALSLIPFNTQPIPMDIAMQPVPRINSGITFVNNAVNGVLPAAIPDYSVNPLRIWNVVGMYAWIIGVSIMLVYGVISYFLLKHKMRFAVHIENNIYKANNIKTPFVLGVFKPKIYLPLGLSEKEREYILLHEQTHIKRHDHLIKFFAYFVLCLHWFNPFAWIAFLLMGADMEMSCDERVIKEMGNDVIHDYSRSLVSLVTDRRIIGGSPLAFGEGGIKQRIKNVLSFRKPARIVVVLAIALTVVLSLGFAINNAYTGEFLGIKKFDIQNVTKIELTDGRNGTVAVITDIDQIAKLTQPYNEHEFLRDARSDIFTGWSFRLVFYRNDKVLEDIIVTNDNTIKSNNRIYMNANGAINIKYYGELLSISNNSAPLATIPITTYEPRKWIDYLYNEQMPWNDSYTIELPEYPGVTFKWNWEKVTITESGVEKELFAGLPVWNVYFADLNGDGFPEVCATVSEGSGISSTGIEIYDYVNDRHYRLHDRMVFDYILSMENAQLKVTQTEHMYINAVHHNVGTLMIINDELVISGLEQVSSGIEPRETQPPQSPDNLPQIMYDGITYYLSGVAVNFEVEWVENTPRIASVVPSFVVPLENNQANFGEPGTPFGRYDTGLITYLNNKLEYFVTADRLRTGNFTLEVFMFINSITSCGLNFMFENHSNKEFVYGSDYALYVRQNDVWEAVIPVIDNGSFNSDGYPILPQEYTELTAVDWTWLYGELPAGEYLFQKSVLHVRQPGDFDKYVLEREFTVQ